MGNLQLPDDLIRLKACEFYRNRLKNNIGGDRYQDWNDAENYLKKHPRKVLQWKLKKKLSQISSKLIHVSITTEYKLESLLAFLKTLAILEILGIFGNVTIIIALFSYIVTEKQRRDAEVYQAWQVITAAYNQSGSGGRKEALEFLNSTPNRFPLLWKKWKRQSLEGLAAPNAYLAFLQTPNAILNKANLQESNLENANLQEAIIRYANLQEAQLTNANLQEAQLTNANLQEAQLTNASLYKAILNEANLRKSNLENANLQEAILTNANFQEATLTDASFHKAILNEANLVEAIFTRANLVEAILTKANLHKAKLWDANLQETILTNVNLQEAILTNANLQGANLTNTNLQGAILIRTNLQKAILIGANLQKAILTKVNLQEAYYTDKKTSKETCKRFDLKYPCPTIFPDNFNPKDHNMTPILNLEKLKKLENITLLNFSSK